jgi:hypothetical protein
VNELKSRREDSCTKVECPGSVSPRHDTIDCSAQGRGTGRSRADRGGCCEGNDPLAPITEMNFQNYSISSIYRIDEPWAIAHGERSTAQSRQRAEPATSLADYSVPFGRRWEGGSFAHGVERLHGAALGCVPRQPWPFSFFAGLNAQFPK